jgi:hypothetical protein
MKTRFGIIFSHALGLFSANAAQVGDAVLGAIVGAVTLTHTLYSNRP